MPELKRLFLRGRMNKDLDERLVPNGEYRDALNIQVGSSEGSDVGAVENILGNQVKRKKPTKQLWEENDATHNYYGLPLDAVCIGAIKDDITDSIYYFVTSSEADCIVKYDAIRDAVSPVLVDTQNILKFSATNLITGVNLIGDYLFFTDNNSEPKRVHVNKFSRLSSDFVTHSQYKGRNFIESDITVIKKSPLDAPLISLSNSKRGGNVITTLNYNFTILQTNSGALSESIIPFNDGGSEQTLAFNTSVDYEISDKIILESDALGTDPENELYIIRGEVSDIVSPNTIKFKVESISPQVPDSNNTLWQVELQQDDAPFERKMIRFGYRWKYNDNQYSTFSPFTEVAFLGSEFDYNPADGYNKGMQNEVRLINVFQPSLYANFTTDFLNKIPVDVKEVEILYKETNNPTIYVVDDITVEAFSDANWEGYKIDSDIIYKVVQSNQLLRPWDNVPRKALAQEIVGNRLVYGNYLQNYTLNTTVSLDAYGVGGASRAEIITATPSVKSNRNYQVGVVFKDEYGRETPVFTSKNGGVRVNKNNSWRQNIIKAKGVGAPPQGFSYYKFFVKDPSGEYYNLAVDSAYISKDNTSVWVAFPSSERNKIQDGDYISLKKGINSNRPVTDANNRYKILDISNETPEELKLTRSIEISELIQFGDTMGTVSASTTLTVGGTPVQDESVFCIAKTLTTPSVTSGAAVDLKKALKQGAYITFENDLGVSGFYRIAEVYYNEDAVSPDVDNAPKIRISGTFGSDVNFLYKNDGTFDLIQPGNTTINVYGTDLNENNENYNGVFFVKIKKDNLILDEFFPGGQYKILNTLTFPSLENLNSPDANLQITDTNYDMPYDPTNNKLISFWGGGVVPKRDNTVAHYNGGLGFADSNNSVWNEFSTNCGDYYLGEASEIIDNKWDVVLELWLRNDVQYYPTFTEFVQEAPNIPRTYFNDLDVGTKIQFENHSTIYTISEIDRVTVRWFPPITGQGDDDVEVATKVLLKFNKPLEQTVNPNFLTGTYPNGVGIRIMGLDQSTAGKTNNPAIFETDPKELGDLNIYYEASDAYPVADYNTTKTLTWHNCFTFGNGVESDRIADDFNAPFVDKGTKASTTLEEPYEEERRSSGLIYSGIFNSNSGLNDLNQFIQAEKITKDLNPIYGSIQKLHTRDTNLVTLCEDKCLRILANKDALFNADGNANLTSTNNVLGQAVPFNGEFGISKNPESFASYGYRAYFSDKKRGVILRLSMDGLTEISNKGMSDYFYDNLKAATNVFGSYDIYSDAYTLTLNNDTVCFKESLDGWPTRKSFIPEWGISLNSDYYTFNNGMIWSHDNEERNTFYEGATEKSSVQLIFNDTPNKIKNFKTISYEGDSGWTVPLIQTDQQDGAVTTFLDKENIYYNYIRGLSDTWNNTAQSGTLDLKQFAAQGIGNILNARNADNTGDYTRYTTFTVTVKNDPNN